MVDASTNDFAAMLETVTDGWKSAMGVRFSRATAEEVIAELVVGPQHRQPLGVVHGGVHAGLIEAVASVGASLSVIEDGRYAVGLENHTSFLHAVRDGALRAVGHPVAAGRKTSVWDVNVFDDTNRIVAAGRVRMLLIEHGSNLGGRAAELGAEPADTT